MTTFEIGDAWLEIGAALTLSEVEARLAGRVPILAEVFPQFASRLIRNTATIGGNLATASPIGDFPPALLALDADVVLASADGDRQVPLAAYFTGYRETVRRAAEGNGRHVRQTGGKGQYGHAVIKLEPQEKGAGYEFVDKIVGGTIPREYIKPIDQGIQETLQTGIYAGYPVVDVKVTLFDGSFHDVDSSEMAFKIAGSLAIKDAFAKADPAILEPIMKV